MFNFYTKILQGLYLLLKKQGKKGEKRFGKLSEKGGGGWTLFTKAAYLVKRGLTRHGEWCILKTIN
jgi:hypothetical protein